MNIIDLATKTMQGTINAAVAAVKSVVDAIKGAVDTTKTNVDSINTRTTTINTNLGAPSTAASNSVSGNAHAKLNYLLQQGASSSGSSVIKSVQTGSSYVGGGNYSTSTTINPVDVKKSILIYDGFATNGNNGSFPIYCSLRSNAVDTWIGWNISGSVNWQVIEFY